MDSTSRTFGEAIYSLPPLILHPFSEQADPNWLAGNSKAGLILAGLAPEEGTDREELGRRYLAGRHAEVRMLFFVGKDSLRWIGQCCECASRIDALSGIPINGRSFANLLTSSPPPNVKEKLISWGVGDYSSIFCRAIGLNTIFAEPPAFSALTEEFLANYHQYADALYRAYMEGEAHRTLTPANFTFELYASGEYSRMLENEWGDLSATET
jgi:hypothetical protein